MRTVFSKVIRCDEKPYVEHFRLKIVLLQLLYQYFVILDKIMRYGYKAMAVFKVLFSNQSDLPVFIGTGQENLELDPSTLSGNAVISKNYIHCV